MSTAARPMPLSITAIADLHRLHRTEVFALITMHGIPTARIGTARTVDRRDWARLEKLILKYQRAKAASA